MSKNEKKRTFESDTLILPALKMVLIESEKEAKSSSRKNAKKKDKKELKEETVLRIISKLRMND